MSTRMVCARGLAAVLVACSAAAPAAAQLKSPVYYPVGSEPQVVVAADFNNDKAVDLATADFSSNDVSILLGNGDGTFQAARQFATATGLSAQAVDDFNGDGNLDAAVANTAGTSLNLVIGRGDGRFKRARDVSFSSGPPPVSVATADFDADGSPDVAVALSYANEVAILLNKR